MFKYNYNGILSEDVIGWVKGLLGKYPFALEVSTMPEPAAFDAIYSDLSWVSHGENCMGQSTQSDRRGVPYAYVRKSREESGGFVLFPTADASKRFLTAFPDLVVNDNPFSTKFE